MRFVHYSLSLNEVMVSTVPVSNKVKGNIGEELVLGGDEIPKPVKQNIESFVRDEYDVGHLPVFRFSQNQGGYIKAHLPGRRETMSWRADGVITCKWASAEKCDGVARRRDFDDTHAPQDEYAKFPIDVKTGTYAELSDRQKAVLEPIAKAQTEVHPVVISVDVQDLPEEYKLTVTFKYRSWY